LSIYAQYAALLDGALDELVAEGVRTSIART